MSFSNFWAHEPSKSTCEVDSKLKVAKISDMHCHLRQGPMLESVVPLVVAGGADTILVMPNLIPPLVNTDQVVQYRDDILKYEPNLQLLMTLYFNKDLTRDELVKAKAHGIYGVKLYPMGVTTNSQYGVSDLSQYSHIFAAIEETGLVLNLHGECPSSVPNTCVLNAEEKFLDTLVWLAKTFPRLKIVLEHATTKAAVDCVKSHPRFFLGSDSAPHPKHSKMTNSPAAGVFTSPILLPLLVSIFDHLGCLPNLERFSYTNGRSFYGLDCSNPTYVTLVKQASVVPTSYPTLLPTKTSSSENALPHSNDIVPFMAAQELPWSFE
ncbi:putative dihydroorotase [Smittium mucronatum]|uniref:Putative dihydroorotase n=1 Tax=Smittium mucronatum TaxID=133383 RepID=A0A1R0H0J2_9FUNG|nr:putative dihydroorotase [Smittium mucronatum]